ncbi:MAG: hypothetical protein IPL79_17085 [Myxococcales bacterium]|nr:hypothetical protein [Myxococcales bacterium]
MTYLTNPLVVYTLRDGELAKERAVVVESIAAGELTFAYGVARRLQLGAALPITFSMRGQGLSPNDARPLPGGLSISGLGDARLEAKYQLVHKHHFAIAGAAGLGAPSSFGNGDSEFLGDNFVSGRVRLGMHWSSRGGGFIIGAHGGFIGRKTREIYAVRVGSQFTWAAGVAFRITDQFSLFGEGFGRTDLDLNYENSPIEAGGGLRLRMGTSLTFSAGGSTGVYGGIGAPDLRVFTSLGWAPDTGDRDGDGVPNAIDKCVSLAEDFDGFKDSDGCPDPDNDGDLKLDGTDKCPTDAEDSDGYQDEDGCPDPDNDGDGIMDRDDQCVDEKEDGKVPHTKDGCPFDKRDTDSDMLPDYLDACPDQEEDMDGFEDADGCPELDNDKDGIDDVDDGCPLCPEDADGVNDGDGCPELDNDGDGVIDAKDMCDGEAETVNGIDDFDGCADEGGAELASFDGSRIILVRTPEFAKTSLGRVGALVMDQVALIMVREHTVTKWTIAVSTRSKVDAENVARRWSSISRRAACRQRGFRWWPRQVPIRSASSHAKKMNPSRAPCRHTAPRSCRLSLRRSP